MTIWFKQIKKGNQIASKMSIILTTSLHIYQKLVIP